MKKVYCVYDGDDYDQTLREIFSTRKLAEEYVKYCGSSYAIIIERVIDCNIDKGNKTYCIEHKKYQNTNLKFIDCTIEPLDLDIKEPFLRKMEFSDCMFVEINATNKNDAINISKQITNKLLNNKSFIKTYNSEKEFYYPVSKFLKTEK